MSNKIFYLTRNIIASLFFIFGAMTILAGGRSLFTEVGIATRGNIVPLVLWFNFIAGFFYLLAGVAVILKKQSLIKIVSSSLAVLSVIVLLYLLNHINGGGLYEVKTLIAMSFRASFWGIFAIYFHKIYSPEK